jgi:hypothetical protein
MKSRSGANRFSIWDVMVIRNRSCVGTEIIVGARRLLRPRHEASGSMSRQCGQDARGPRPNRVGHMAKSYHYTISPSILIQKDNSNEGVLFWMVGLEGDAGDTPIPTKSQTPRTTLVIGPFLLSA